MSSSMPRDVEDERRRAGFVREHSLLCFFLLTFGLSWAGMLAAVLLSPGGLATTPEQLQESLGVAIAGMLLGPLVAGLVMTWVVDGRGGFHELRRRLTRWRVGLRWYAFALLVAPLVMGGTLLLLSLVSRDFLPRIGTEQNRLPLLAMGLAVGVTVAFCEEIGWTGFAVPRMRLRWGSSAPASHSASSGASGTCCRATTPAASPRTRSRWPYGHRSGRWPAWWANSLPTECSWCGCTNAPAAACC